MCSSDLGDHVAEATGVAVAHEQVGRRTRKVLQLLNPVLLQQIRIQDRGRRLNPYAIDAKLGLDLERCHDRGARIGGKKPGQGREEQRR